MNTPKYLRNHEMYADYDYEYLHNKGYTNREILAIWQRDSNRGCTPIAQAPQIPDVVSYFKPIK